VSEKSKLASFEETVMPHLDAAYNLARWLTRSDTDAEDVVQEAYLRAYKFFNGFHGVNAKAWTLQIVRNSFYSWRRKNSERGEELEFDEDAFQTTASNPETILIEQIDRQELKHMLNELPDEFREIVVLRELEGQSYKEIATIADLPLGTVMSRLARARERLHAAAMRRREGLK
jgi:RNA polymerase sigma factor (sigma-70 family)